jgi:hypothetical protein
MSGQRIFPGGSMPMQAHDAHVVASKVLAGNKGLPRGERIQEVRTALTTGRENQGLGQCRPYDDVQALVIGRDHVDRLGE